MGSADIAPPHVPSHVVPVSNALLAIGGALWTLCYILLVRASRKTRSYGMPLFALALNFAWEIVYALYVTEELFERVAFTVWLVIDIGLVHALLRFGPNEWAHAPLVQRHLPVIFTVLTAVGVLAHYAFARWWIDAMIGAHRGKSYGGVLPGPDTTELGFWSATLCQVYLSAASLAQLLVRGHSGGVTYGVWAARAMGTAAGLYGYYGFRWWFWPEGHEYFTNPFAVFMCVVGALADAAYPFVLASVRRTERVLVDGRRIPAGAEPLQAGYVMAAARRVSKKVA